MAEDKYSIIDGGHIAQCMSVEVSAVNSSICIPCAY